jgi:hypothetical protein
MCFSPPPKQPKCGTGGQSGATTPSTVFPYWNDVTITANGGCGWRQPPSPSGPCDETAAWAGQFKVRIQRLINLGSSSTQSQASSLSSSTGGLAQLQSTSYGAVMIATSTTRDQFGGYVIQVCIMVSFSPLPNPYFCIIYPTVAYVGKFNPSKQK